MRTLTDSGLIVKAPNLNVFTKEANVLYVTYTSESAAYDNAVTMTIAADIKNIGGLSARYICEDGKCEIDIQTIIDIVKQNGQEGGSVTITTATGESILVDFVVRGFSRPVFVPNAGYLTILTRANIYAVSGLNEIILPPSYILAPVGGAPLRFPAVFNAVREVHDAYNTYTGETYAQLKVSATGYNLYNGADNEILHIPMQPLESCREYCALRWADRLTGLQKVCTFEMSKLTYSTASEVALMRLDKTYNVLKGEVCTFTARLPKLTAYDYNYYADIITADFVECYKQGEWTAVYINTESATILDGDAELTDFEINVIYKRNEY